MKFVFIELYKQGKLFERIEVDLPSGRGLKLFTIRRLIIDEKVKEIQKLNPYCQLILVFESKMNFKKRDKIIAG